MDELKDFETGVIGGFDEGGLLLVVEISGDCDDRGIDRFSSVVGGRFCQALELTCCNLRDGYGGWGVSLLILYGKCDRSFVFLGVGRGMAVGGVYRLEAGTNISNSPRAPFGAVLLLTKEVSEICDGVFAISDKLLFGLLAIVLIPVNVG